ncbi:MAG: glycosyl hydrolase 115 family protein [Sphingobacteriaceae bacterium]|nr:glycosyl hydrolase 115 family protein [Sphingobacteriaceae bacterium]
MNRIIFILIALLSVITVNANDDKKYVSPNPVKSGFPLVLNGDPVAILSSDSDHPGINRAIKNFQSDMQLVFSKRPSLISSARSTKVFILIGTIGKNPEIDALIKNGKLNAAAVKGKWESSVTQIVTSPFPGVEKALVIAGSDRRGTIFGIYDLSAQIGVSPWYWWADVPVKPQTNLHVIPGVHIRKEPVVKYRGIFINDEAPALSGWAYEKFGGFNSKFYEKVFELMLRLRANYLWPAMWGKAFYDDDPENAALANDMGIVIGTSHHEPLMRAHSEWKKYGKGAWNYSTNEAVLKDFWRGGMKRMGSNESIVTIGMRGDGDEPMSEQSNITLLEKIVKDQRQIIREETKKPAEQTPQIWALYKEVQEYYDKGMRVPDDVTLLLCDDNWGNIRKLPKLDEKPRKGGYGIYYHYDYVGDPRNYKWLNTNQISKVWEQMNLAYEYGANKIWIVNVGDIKPMEFPTEFFLDLAWNPKKWPSGRLQEYTRLWAEKQFGAVNSAAIADIISKYTRYNARRKPELLSPDTYSLTNYREFERVVFEYNTLLQEAEQINQALDPSYRDAYFQLVLHPVKACANLYELYFTVAKNRLYAQQGRVSTNLLANRAKDLFERDAAISNEYNKGIANGKWNHMMDQTHISYTYWQQPEKDTLPSVERIIPLSSPQLGVSIEGSNKFWLEGRTDSLKISSEHQPSPYFELFNRGENTVSYTISNVMPWLKISSLKGSFKEEERVWLSLDWPNVPKGKHMAPLIISAGGKRIEIALAVTNIEIKPGSGFIEDDGYISIEAEHYTKAVNGNNVVWKKLPDYGKTLSGLTTLPAARASSEIKKDSPRLEYQVFIQNPGQIDVHTYLSPSLDFTQTSGLRFAVSIDDEAPQVINLNEDKTDEAWKKAVGSSIKIITTRHLTKTPGKHTIKFWRIEPGVVLQKIVLDTGGLRPSYLGPPESKIR